MKKATLSEKQILFITNYIMQENKNATKAAVDAGYSEKTAKQKACSLLKDGVVCACVCVGERLKQEFLQVNSKLKDENGRIVNNNYVLEKRLEILKSSLQKVPKKVWDYEKRKYVDDGKVIVDGAVACKVLNDIERSLSALPDDEFNKKTIEEFYKILEN